MMYLEWFKGQFGSLWFVLKKHSACLGEKAACFLSENAEANNGLRIIKTSIDDRTLTSVIISGFNEAPRPEGRVSCKRYIVYEVRSVRKLFNRGVYYHFLSALPILTALKLPRRKAGSWVLDPTANKSIILYAFLCCCITANNHFFSITRQRGKQYDTV
jgi:hypothetical protein